MIGQRRNGASKRGRRSRGANDEEEGKHMKQEEQRHDGEGDGKDV